MFDTPTALPPNTIPSGWEAFMLQKSEGENQDLKRKIEQYEKDLIQLRDEKFELEKQVAFKDKEHQLDVLEIERTRANSLNGFIEKASNNENIMNAIGMLAGKMVNTETGQQQLGQVSNEYAANLSEWISGLPATEQQTAYEGLLAYAQIPAKQRKQVNDVLHKILSQLKPQNDEDDSEDGTEEDGF